MVRRRYILYIVFVLIAAAYYYWTHVYVFTPVEAFVKSNIQHRELLHSAVVKNGVLLFYRDTNSGIGVAYEVHSNLTGWQHITGGGSAELINNDYISWCWSRLEDGERETGVTFGELIHPDVTAMKAKMVNGNLLIEKEATIVDFNGGRLWYVVSDKAVDTVKMYAYSSSGQLLFTHHCFGEI